MITLITGAPGSGKTAALVQLLERFAKEGRPIFVDGIPDLKIGHVELADPRKWHTDVPDGSVIVIDEVQRVWRPAGTGATVPPDVEALETHRHKGIEFYLVTQHPNLLHANVRRLVGRHIHLRDVGVLGRWWYEWPEATNPEAWRTAPIKQRYKLPRRVFGQYRSASLHVKPIRKLPPALIVAVVAIVGVAFLGHRVYARISDMTSPLKSAELKAITGTPPGQGQDTPPPAPSKGTGDAARSAAAPAPSPPQEAQEDAPRLVGCIRMGPRCECISDEGKSVEVELSLCQQSAERGGTGVPYLLRYPKSSPLQASPSAALVTPPPGEHVGKSPEGGPRGSQPPEPMLSATASRQAPGAP